MEHIELDEFGRLAFRHIKNKNIFLHKPFRWINRGVVLDEKEGRRVLEDKLFTSYNMEEWVPVTKEQDQNVKRTYMEIYEKN